MIKIEPLEAPEPPTKFEFIEFLDQNYDWYYNWLDNASLDYIYDFYYDWILDEDLEWLQSKKLSLIIFEEYFNGDWRNGHEFHKIVITHRLYQISSTATQAWFLNSNFAIKRLEILVLECPLLAVFRNFEFYVNGRLGASLLEKNPEDFFYVNHHRALSSKIQMT